MNTTFDEITKSFIKSTLAKKNTSMLALIMFYEIRGDIPEESFRMLSCVFYRMVRNMSVLGI